MRVLHKICAQSIGHSAGRGLAQFYPYPTTQTDGARRMCVRTKEDGMNGHGQTSARWYAPLALLTMGLCVAGQAQAQEPSQDKPAHIAIELNQTEQLDANCRLTFTAHNTTGGDIDSLVLETVLFDTSGGVRTLSLFDFQSLPNGTPRVRQFDLGATTCADLGQVLINGVATCEGATPAECQKALSLSSRTKHEVLG